MSTQHTLLRELFQESFAAGFKHLCELWHPCRLRHLGSGPSGGTERPPPRSPLGNQSKDRVMKGIFAWLIGIPIPIIILLYLADVF